MFVSRTVRITGPRTADVRASPGGRRRFRRYVTPLLGAPADTAIADGNRPVIEEIAADRHFVAAVVVLPGVMGFESDGEQIVHKRFPFK